MSRGLCALFFIITLLSPFSALAAIPDVYTNDNFLASEHDKPVSLFLDGSGGFYGYTYTGKFYQQLPISNAFGIRLQKFSIDEAYFYMSDKGMIQADNDLIAISIYFTRQDLS